MMKLYIFIFIISIISILPAVNGERKISKTNQASPGGSDYSIINVSNFSSYILSNGIGSNHPLSEDAGAFYPRGTAGVVYSDGLVWAGLVIGDPTDSGPSLRVGGQIYYSSTAAGWVENGRPVSPSDPRARVYRIRDDWQSLSQDELKREAADIFGIEIDSVNSEQTTVIYNKYAEDWQNWPVELGAPFVDQNENGKWDGSGIDRPGLPLSGQVIYFIMNDFSDSLTTRFLGSRPLGLEIHVLIYAYNNTGSVYGQCYFKHYRIINKSDYLIDSLYLGHFADTDIGYFADDYCGCDPENNLAFAYNSQATDIWFEVYGLPPSAVGNKLLLGPVVPSAGDTAVLNFQLLHGYRNLPMTAFNFENPGSAKTYPYTGESDYNSSLIWYNILRGYMPTSDIDNPTPQYYGGGSSGTPTKFPLSGNPFTMVGDLDGQGENYQAGERRIVLASGPCSLAPGGSQEFHIAVIGGNLDNQLASYETMVMNSSYITGGPMNVSFADDTLSAIDSPGTGCSPKNPELKQNYPNPFNPSTTIEFYLPQSEFASLKIYNVLGEEVVGLVSEEMKTGTHRVNFDGGSFPSGIYFYSLKTKNVEISKKMILLR